ncbi:MAG: type III polyketide synthase [Pseudomonadota bacterium]
MSIQLSGLGTAVPDNTIDQTEALELAHAVLQPDADKARLLKPLYRRSGVKNRHICVPSQTALDWIDEYPAESNNGGAASLGGTTRTRMQLYEEHAPQLALAASTAALQQSDFAPESISHVVTVSCTGFCAPGVDTRLIHELNLKPYAERIHVGFMGCHGAINGIRTARAIAAQSESHRVLLCAVELCSLHYCFEWVPDRLVSNAIFADGAAAAVVADSQSRNSCCEIIATGSYIFPQTADAMSWRLGNHGFEMSLDARVPDLIGTSLKPWVSRWLAKQGLTPQDVAHWAVHPGGPRIVSAVAEALDLPATATESSRAILSQYGNMSSPTVLFILEKLLQERAEGSCVMIAFGPGLVAEATLLRFTAP